MNEFEQKLVDFKEIVLGLKNILKLENDALEAFKLNDASALYEAKSKAVNVYRDFVAFFIKNNELLQAIKAEDKETLKILIVELNEFLAQNEILLKTRIETSKNVMDSIINIAKNNNKSNSTSYGKMGNYSQRERMYNAIAINQTL